MVGRVDADAGPDRVSHDVGAGRVEVALGLDHAGREAVGDEVPETAVSLVEPLCVDTVEALHPFGEVEAARFEDEVEVRCHQAEGVHFPVKAGDATAEEREEEAAVLVVAEERDAAGATRDDVEEAVGERGAEQACDESRVEREHHDVNPVNTSAHFRHKFSRLRWPWPGSDPGHGQRRRLGFGGRRD